MYDEPEHNEYDDDEYKYYPDSAQFHEYNEHGFPKPFKFDWDSWEIWLSQAIKDIVHEKDNVWLLGNYKSSKEQPVSNNISKIPKNKYFEYLGNNNYDEAIWKRKYFVVDKMQQEYKNHISSHAAHFVKQPIYYKGLFDNLN